MKYSKKYIDIEINWIEIGRYCLVAIVVRITSFFIFNRLLNKIKMCLERDCLEINNAFNETLYTNIVNSKSISCLFTELFVVLPNILIKRSFLNTKYNNINTVR